MENDLGPKNNQLNENFCQTQVAAMHSDLMDRELEIRQSQPAYLLILFTCFDSRAK